MLDEYSIEQRATQIFDARSKEYFSEVLSCYSAGNHRSAVVMLWSVMVCDLLFKLQHLVDLYGDAKANSILAEIGQMQQDNERSPVWETKLVESVAEQTHSYWTLLNVRICSICNGSAILQHIRWSTRISSCIGQTVTRPVL
ncbi:MAG TPA: hypothetical protein VGK09_02470 [Rhodocyclaceae bacterium]|jgi:hypothetical protein